MSQIPGVVQAKVTEIVDIKALLALGDLAHGQKFLKNALHASNCS